MTLWILFLAGSAFAAPAVPPTDPAVSPPEVADSSTEPAVPSTEPADSRAEAPPIPSADNPELSPDEMAALLAAIAADTPPPPPPPPATGLLQSLNPDISFSANVAFAYFGPAGAEASGGHDHAEEEADAHDQDEEHDDAPLMSGGHDPSVNGFTLQALEMSVSKSVDPYFKFNGNLAFSLEGVEIEEVYATTLALPGRFQLRAGQFLTRFGRINQHHLHSWEFVDQTFMVGRVFGGEGNRGLGVEASWLAPLPWYLEVVGSVTGAGGEGTARSFYAEDDPGFRTPLDFQDTIAVKQFFPLGPDLSLAFGLSTALGPNATGEAHRTELYGTDVYLKYRPVTQASPLMVSLQSEWILRQRELEAADAADITGYTQLFLRFAQRWGTTARYELGTPAVDETGEAVVDPLDPDWTEDRHRAALSLCFWPSEFSRIRLQGEADFAGWRDEPGYAGFLAFEFNVGAHGAHVF